MKKILASSLLLASSAIHAGCGELDIRIINTSTHNCIFKNKVVTFGILPSWNVPTVISAGQASPTITASQDDVGVQVQLTYMCDNEIVKFTSLQQYCSIFGAGEVWGLPNESTTLNLEYTAESGSSLFGSPGKITWRIS
jgi:hypothetical protein